MCTVPLGGYATEADFSQETLQLIYVGKGTEKDYKGLEVSGRAVLIDIDQMNEWWINFRPMRQLSMVQRL